jgi:hypothetical protein
MSDFPRAENPTTSPVRVTCRAVIWYSEPSLRCLHGQQLMKLRSRPLGSPEATRTALFSCARNHFKTWLNEGCAKLHNFAMETNPTGDDTRCALLGHGR